MEIEKLIKEKYLIESEIIEIEYEMTNYFIENRGKKHPTISDEWQDKRNELHKLRNKVELIKNKINEQIKTKKIRNN